jgi:NADPH:quinone reductase
VVGGGAQAQLLAVHERQLMPVPESLTWQQAGGFPEAFVTAHDALVTQSGVRPGDRVLITGAAGGVAGVQIAAALRGEGPWATYRQPATPPPVPTDERFSPVVDLSPSVGTSRRAALSH